MLARLCLLSILLGCMIATVQAGEDTFPFKAEQQRVLFKKLSDELRCPKCLGQNLSGSNSLVAEVMKKKVYQFVIEGKSEQEIVNFFVARYGEFVRYRPQLAGHTLFLWVGPLLLALLAGVIIWRVIRRHTIDNA